MRLRAATFLATILLLNLLFGAPLCRGEADPAGRLDRDAAALKTDFKRFYLDADNIICLLAVGTVSGILANTDIDREFQEYYRDDIRSGWTDNGSKVFKVPGEVLVTAPLLLGARLVLDDDSPAGQWADRSLRALLVGGPAGLLIQRVTGAGRPTEGDSKWRPFENNNGLSGHAFVGAVPFITAARMQDDPYMKGLYYALSILPAATRINDNEHYLSQALLGWYLAYLSAGAVDRKDAQDEIAFFIVPIKNNGILFKANIEF